MPVWTRLLSCALALALAAGCSTPNSVSSRPPAPAGLSLPELELEGFRPDDPGFALQWNLTSAKVDLAWQLARGSHEITVAVIDSGVDPEHPDLAEHLEPLEDIYGEMNGKDVYPLLIGDLDFSGIDGNGHGTHVTGIIAASLNNGVGVAGVAGGIRILPIKATNYAGQTDAAMLVRAFERAIERGADVINVSIGGPPEQGSQALQAVVQRALARGIPIIAATGNETARSAGKVAPITVPAAYEGVIAVGAETELEQVADYSNGGPELDLIAPGGSSARSGREGRRIWSTWPGYPTFENIKQRVDGSRYAALSGSSMAAPHVTGVVALMLAREPGLTPEQVRARLITSAEDVGPEGFDPASGYGRLNAYRALSLREGSR